MSARYSDQDLHGGLKLIFPVTTLKAQITQYKEKEAPISHLRWGHSAPTTNFV